ncbi:MAG: hypothetical protein NTZ17_20810, partial [Phycisphaerae bacterium]|nr:hypothetical protein [Phycisphaerae bacterium]
MFENEHDFRKLVSSLKIDAEANPAHRERLRRQMLRAFEQAEGIRQRTVGAGPRACPTPGNHRGLPLHVRLAIAAVLLIAAAAGVWTFFGRGPMTFHQVRMATQKAPWLYAVVSRFQNGEVRTERHWYNFAAQKAYAMLDDGSAVGWDYAAGPQKLAYNPRVKTLTISDLSAPGVGGASTENLPSVFAVFAAKDDVSGSASQQEGRTVQSFEIERTEPGLASPQRGSALVEPGLSIGGRAVSLLKARVLADPGTGHIVAASIEYQGGSGGALAREEWVMSYPPS